MTDVAPRGGKGSGQMGRLDGAGEFEEDSRQNEAFHKAEVIGRKGFGRNRVEAQRRALDREHRTLAKKGFNAHHRPEIVYKINYLEQDKSIVVRTPKFLNDGAGVSA